MNRGHAHMRPSGLVLLSAIVFTFALIASDVLARAATSNVTIGGPFTLVAPDGKAVTDQSYRGKWLLVYFGYTFCPNSCPTTLLEIATALKQLGPAAVNVQPLFITVDPQRDTTEVMRQYTQSFDPRIIGLTGTPEEIATVAREYGAYYVSHRTGPGDKDYVMDHSTYLYVMSPEGKYIRAFDSGSSADQIADALRQLLQPTAHQEGAAG
jgi:protein SCO1